MNFTTYMDMPIMGHADIDFADVHVDGDNPLYIDPERIMLSDHPFAAAAYEAISDFFDVLCQASAERNDARLYRLLSFGHEPNETHLGLSSFRSCGRGTTPEIMMPIVHDMIRSGLFDAGLVTQLSDLHLWTPNFHYDRLSDLTTNIIRSVLVEYTYSQYHMWALPLPTKDYHSAPTWDVQSHSWIMEDFPHFLSGRYPTLLVPKSFVGRRMLSSPGELLHKYALRYRQQEHLDERTDYCHRKTRKNGNDVWTPPTKRELYHLEVKGQPAKKYLRQVGTAHPNMVRELHADHLNSTPRKPITMSNSALDYLLYQPDYLALESATC